MKWLRDGFSHWMGWETYEEAYARIWAEMEFRYPRETPEQRAIKMIEARLVEEAKRMRLDGVDGEYERGMEGLQ